MLYKIDYSTRSGSTATKWVNHAADKVEAMTRFMDWFFSRHSGDAVRIDQTTEVEFTGVCNGIY